MRSDWIHSRTVDTLGILAPPFLATALICLWAPARVTGEPVSPILWLFVILGIDVAHVYASLYRTYFDPAERERHSTLFLATPFTVWISGVLLHSINANYFWTVLAYLAVFHFVRQQYGFVRLYTRNDPWRWKRLDAAAIYMAALYPLIYWHTNLPRDFHWLIEGDFLALPGWLEPVSRGAYVLTSIAYLSQEALRWKHEGRFNLPKNAVVIATALSWYAGIVLFNADLAFTLTNVISHGVPYLVLVWIASRTKWPRHRIFSPAAIPVFLGALVALAYIEEALWDTLIWREHLGLFFGGAGFEPLTRKSLVSLCIPLLATPQATHYVLDAFIWKRSVWSPEHAGFSVPSINYCR